MNDVFVMDGNGPYVWAAYTITLVVVVWNIWAARARLKRNLRMVAREPRVEEQERRPKISRM